MPLLIDAYHVFLLDRQAQNLAKKSLDTYRRRLQKFIDWCIAKELYHVGDLTVNHIRLYQMQLVKQYQDVTAKNHAVDVKTFLTFCVGEGFISESPARRVKLPKVVERFPTVLTAEQVQKLYRVCETGRDRALLLVLLDTGARLEETANMQVTDVDFGQGMIVIREGKPRRDRRCYISPRTQKELMTYIRAWKLKQGALWRSEKGRRALTESGIGQIIKRMRDRADVPECKPHNLRKTFVTTMLRAGVDVFTVKELSGHRSLEALEPYVAISKADAQKAHAEHSPVQILLE